MGTPGLFVVVVIGLLAGSIGRAVLLGRPSRFAALLAGLVGATAGPPVAGAFGYPATNLWQIALAALAGAVVLLPFTLLLRRR